MKSPCVTQKSTTPNHGRLYVIPSDSTSEAHCCYTGNSAHATSGGCHNALEPLLRRDVSFDRVHHDAIVHAPASWFAPHRLAVGRREHLREVRVAAMHTEAPTHSVA